MEDALKNVGYKFSQRDTGWQIVAKNRDKLVANIGHKGEKISDETQSSSFLCKHDLLFKNRL